MMSIVDYLASEREMYLPIVKRFIDDQQNKYSTLTPEFSEMLDQLETYLLRGGKWHRPALGVLAYRITGGTDLTLAREVLVALEIVHRFLLIHDDIIDQDLERHSGPTLEKYYQERFKRSGYKNHQMYSKGNAIVAGDVVFSMAYEVIAQSRLADAIKVAVIKAVNQLMMETGAGWQLQTEQNFMKIEDVSEEAFFTGMQLVSGLYSVVWPLRIGQFVAGRGKWDKNLEEYGWHAGAAFQIMDDILGMFGDEKETGKPVGHDYREGKKTFLVLKAYQAATEADKAFLQETLGTNVSQNDVLRVQAIMKDTKAFEAVRQMALDHAKKAKHVLAHLQTKDSQAVELLESLADFLSNRTH